MTREWAGVVAAPSPPRTRDRRRGDRLADGVVATVARAARQRAVRPDRRGRPRAAAALPARPPRPLPGRDPRARRRAGCASRPGAPASVRAGDPDAAGPRRWCSPPTASCSRRTRWSTTRSPTRRPRRGAALGLLDRGLAAMTAPVNADPRAGLAGAPDRRSTWWSSGSASPAPAWRSTPPPAACRVLAVDAHDLAFGTSRWSLQARARRPALPRQGPGRRRPRERRRARHPDGGHRPAPHPAAADAASRSTPSVAGAARPASTRAGLLAGDVLRRGAHTAADDAPPAAPALGRPRPSRSRPALRAAGLRGGLLVVGRPARGRRPAGHHRRPHRGRARRPRAHPRPGARRDRHRRRRCATSSPAATATVRARAVVNATGVWAGDLVAERHAAAQPRHPPGAARRDAARAAASR